MKRSEVRRFIEKGVETINPVMPFGSGRITEWNANRSNEYPGVWLDDTQEVGIDLITFQVPNDAWPIVLHIGKLDKIDSSASQYEQLIDDCDEIAQKLINQYNNEIEGTATASLSSIGRQPFVKKHADCISGVILTFTLTIPDQTSLC